MHNIHQQFELQGINFRSEIERAVHLTLNSLNFTPSEQTKIKDLSNISIQSHNTTQIEWIQDNINLLTTQIETNTAAVLDNKDKLVSQEHDLKDILSEIQGNNPTEAVEDLHSQVEKKFKLVQDKVTTMESKIIQMEEMASGRHLELMSAITLMQSSLIHQQQDTANREEERHVGLANKLHLMESAAGNTREHIMRELQDIKHIILPIANRVPPVQSTPLGYRSFPSIPRLSTSPIGAEQANYRGFREPIIQETQENSQGEVPTVPFQTRPNNGHREGSLYDKEKAEITAHNEMMKQLKKDYPRDWPKFSGEGEYNHNDFIDWVDQVKEEFEMPDKLITAKLSLVLTGTAKEWYTEKRKDAGAMPWEHWRTALEDRFGTDAWRNKMEETLLVRQLQSYSTH